MTEWERGIVTHYDSGPKAIHKDVDADVDTERIGTPGNATVNSLSSLIPASAHITSATVALTRRVGIVTLPSDSGSLCRHVAVTCRPHMHTASSSCCIFSSRPERHQKYLLNVQYKPSSPCLPHTCLNLTAQSS